MSSDLPVALSYADKLSRSGLIPSEFQRKPENVLFAIEIARDLNVSPVTAMRGIYVLNGRVGFYVHFMLMMANRSGRFLSPVRYAVEGEGASLSVTATVSLKGSNGPIEVSESYSLAIAVAENLTRNPKYKTNPVQMLKKRCVRALIDNYCPEVMAGLGTDDLDEDHEYNKRQNAVSVSAPANVVIASNTETASTWDLSNKAHRALVGTALKNAGIGRDEQMQNGDAIKTLFQNSDCAVTLKDAEFLIKQFFSQIPSDDEIMQIDEQNNEEMLANDMG